MMNVIDVYTKKEYECKKCKAKVYYAKVTDDSGNIVTKDGQPPNGKFGKESNVLSAQVDATVKDRIHKCNEDYIRSQVDKVNASKPVDLPKFTPEFVKEHELQIWNDIIAKCAEYSILAQKKLDEYPEIQNPALRGLITKVGFDVLTEMKRRESDDS